MTVFMFSKRYWIHPSLNVKMAADQIRKESLNNNISNTILNAKSTFNICGPSTYMIQLMDIFFFYVTVTLNLGESYEIFKFPHRE